MECTHCPKGNAHKIRWVLIKSRAKHHFAAAKLSASTSAERTEWKLKAWLGDGFAELRGRSLACLGVTTMPSDPCPCEVSGFLAASMGADTSQCVCCSYGPERGSVCQQAGSVEPDSCGEDTEKWEEGRIRHAPRMLHVCKHSLEEMHGAVDSGCWWQRMPLYSTLTST